jgi:hypothetical protein
MFRSTGVNEIHKIIKKKQYKDCEVEYVYNVEFFSHMKIIFGWVSGKKLLELVTRCRPTTDVGNVVAYLQS